MGTITDKIYDEQREKDLAAQKERDKGKTFSFTPLLELADDEALCKQLFYKIFTPAAYTFNSVSTHPSMPDQLFIHGYDEETDECGITVTKSGAIHAWVEERGMAPWLNVFELSDWLRLSGYSNI